LKKNIYGEPMKRIIISVIAVFAVTMSILWYGCTSSSLTSAKLYIQQKNYDKALIELKKEIEANPNSDEGYYLLGTVYAEKEDYDKMIESYNKSLSISNQFEKEINISKKVNWANLFNKGVGFYKNAINTKNEDSSKIYYNKSIYAYSAAIQLQPDSADTYKNLSLIYITQSMYDDAIPVLQKLIELKKTLDGYKFLGEIYYSKGLSLKNQYDQSKNVSDSLKSQEYFDDAINTLEAGRKLYPNDSELFLYLSNSYISANKISVATDTFKDAVTVDPNNKNYRYIYGVLLLNLNNYDSAIVQFKKAVEIDPDYLNAIYNLGTAYVKWGAKLAKDAGEKEDPESKVKYNLALPYLETYVQKKPDDAQAWDLLGKVYSVLGKLKEADDAFKKVDALGK
jgi:tetratricopeptide (TPR) repeat protein